MHMERTVKILMGLIAGVLMIFATSSCSKDEMNEKNIEGKWQSTNVNYKEYEAGKLAYEESETCIEWYLGFNFKSDGTGQIISYEEGESETIQITWVIMGEKLMITQYVEGESDTITFDIIQIKSSSMTLSITDEYTYDGVQCKDITTYNFKKI